MSFLPAFAFVAAIGATPLAIRVLSAPFISSIGVASYSIYLIHQPIIELLVARGIHPAIAALSSLTAGCAFWWFVERTFVAGPIRDRLISEFRAFLPRWLMLVGIAPTMNLRRTTGPQFVIDAGSKEGFEPSLGAASS
jgi:peptidoglycan/LPS O-acetylase OafA/YrhL